MKLDLERTILGVRWFSGKSAIGIVLVQPEYGELKAYIGTGLGHSATDDIEYIADYGSTFPVAIASVLINGEA